MSIVKQWADALGDYLPGTFFKRKADDTGFEWVSSPGTSSNLIQEQTLTAPSSAVNFTGLNSLVDGAYTIEAEVSFAGTVASAIICYVNGVTAGYSGTWTEQNATSAMGRNFTFPQIGLVIEKGSNVSTSTLVLRVVIQSGRVLMSSYGSFEKDSSTYYGTYRAGSSLSTLQTSITSLQLCGFASEAGSTFRLYASKRAVATQTVASLTAAITDYPLAVGETASLTFTAATSVPLHIATVEGEYEVTVIGTSSTTTSPSDNLNLQANNATYPSAYTRQFLMSLGTNVSGDTLTADSSVFISYGGHIRSVARISTFTLCKSAVSEAFYKQGAAYNSFKACVYWRDTTTPWVSLGTLTFPSAQSGTVMIRRLL